ncbi:hypothetical protein NG796_17330 [Laspinema sp. A4]|uniref:hypothetical protein n=1 Tax=Laspinema sp. D2d TaxID=2953686 RepID=UPI0021BA6629|nr:hypothetical protein [Laspinema sp. D2d]MCT7985037.1 hypothetical protein [Laspinema sp. D2d]
MTERFATGPMFLLTSPCHQPPWLWMGWDVMRSHPRLSLIHPPRGVVQKSVREGVAFPVDPWLVVSPLPPL